MTPFKSFGLCILILWSAGCRSYETTKTGSSDAAAQVEAGADADMDADMDSDADADADANSCTKDACRAKDDKVFGLFMPSWCDGYYECGSSGGCRFVEPNAETGTVCPRPDGDPEAVICCEWDYPENPQGAGRCAKDWLECRGACNDCCENASCWAKDTRDHDGLHPSWCNGYFQCNCWGGCQYYPPNDAGTVCPRPGGDPTNTMCCEGNYPYDPCGSGACVPPDTVGCY